MPEKLNKARPHGIVYGDPQIGYEQDGKQYRHDLSLYVPEAPVTEQQQQQADPDSDPDDPDARAAAPTPGRRRQRGE